ncbi:Protein of unknown function (DUF664) [Streptomyces lincolnensis]|uniref:Uncharacterized protein n=1 Tax=Streptomyces lincolnensis TaxID=1915 RepID=A0A1B1M937_STRLN|nr:DinB family protein [Streptomyces lincolnensis]ANS64922.1 Protein of unknown function (DUF664) [Streptomyces lincolnensis]AXG56869.1 hypothetical protein SLCG_5714 [Streptomyces lincolnensis]QMV06717.1 DUF664 domain-containing protein [Streptomyces lincolnensis]
MTATTPPQPALAPHGEHADLLADLATARSSLTRTVRGLDDERAGERPTVSALCLGGLVKHVTAMEEGWLRFVVEGPTALSYDLPDGVTWADITSGTAREIPQWLIDHQSGFRMEPGETLADILKRYEEVAARTEEFIASVPDLSATHQVPEAPWGEPATVYSVRRVLTHVLHETAQHAGHADILRETLDGQTAT